MDASYLRHFHASEIFNRIRIEPEVSQREIVERTGFDKSTVSSIVNIFVEQGLVERRSKNNSSKRGRPSEGLVISPSSGLLVGVEVEADELVFVSCGLDGGLLGSLTLSFDGELGALPAKVAEGIDSLTTSFTSKSKLLGIGVSLPGLMTLDGRLVHVPVLGWREVDILERLRTVCAAPIYVGNDGNAAAMAEHMFGACIDVDNFIYLMSGSGVGGALFLDGQIYKGHGGLAGELGHIKIVPQGRFCTCGAAGCLSAYLSRTALIEEVSRLGLSKPSSFEELLELAATGDSIVLNVLSHAGDVLGSAVSSLINIFNPPVVLLGGDMALAAPFLQESLDRSLQRLAHPAMYSRSTVKFADPVTGGPRLGGVALALDGVTDIQSSHVLPRTTLQAERKLAHASRHRRPLDRSNAVLPR